MALYGSIDDVDVKAISKSISDTAVDIFIYDTRKDSDGGAWRKRTQHTSWYNETLNTATRGSRKEFPSVAVIVADSSRNVTIYDGDDPDLPMWMVFNSGSGTWIICTTGGLSLSMLNGVMSVACDGTNQRFRTIDFIKERHREYSHTDGQYSLPTGIVTRNSAINGSYESGTVGLIHRTINDVAMTVLPNAPIDADTGLPIPTIAVATSGGVSVIKDDGNIYDFTNGTTPLADYISFTDDNRICFFVDDAGGQRKWVQIFDIPSSDTAYNFSASPNNYYATYTLDGVSSRRPALAPGATSDANNDGITFKQNVAVADPKGLGVGTIDQPAVDPNNNMVFYSTSDYNTGWMHGNIKLATLSDTDDTNVTGSELVTNGTFDTNVSDWLAGNATITHSSGEALVTTSGAGHYVSQTITVLPDTAYTYSWRARRGTMSQIYMSVYDTSNGQNIRGPFDYGATTSMASYSVTFTTPANCTSINVYLIRDSGTTGTAYFDDASLRLAEEDRSVNGNGLQVFGTVTKSAVATGADLVAYSGFSSSNYLEQPYNSDLDFGTGDFCIMGWVKPSSVTVTSVIIDRGNGSNNTNRLVIYASNADLRFQINAADYVATSALSLNTWKYVTLVRNNGRTKLYLNGEVGVSTSGATGSVNSSGVTRLGVSQSLTNPTNGSLALWRISATVPSPEQIKKIYEDEKVLFQENAKATLYGSSDSVTALAYDDSTELLHVGTSAGRSVFQGLRRVDNTTDAVGAAISASNGMVADD